MIGKEEIESIPELKTITEQLEKVLGKEFYLKRISRSSSVEQALCLMILAYAIIVQEAKATPNPSNIPLEIIHMQIASKTLAGAMNIVTQGE